MEKSKERFNIWKHLPTWKESRWWIFLGIAWAASYQTILPVAPCISNAIELLYVRAPIRFLVVAMPIAWSSLVFSKLIPEGIHSGDLFMRAFYLGLVFGGITGYLLRTVLKLLDMVKMKESGKHSGIFWYLPTFNEAKKWMFWGAIYPFIVHFFLEHPRVGGLFWGSSCYHSVKYISPLMWSFEILVKLFRYEVGDYFTVLGVGLGILFGVIIGYLLILFLKIMGRYKNPSIWK